MCATPASAPVAAGAAPATGGSRAASSSTVAGAAQSLGHAASLPRISTLAAHALNRAYAWPAPFALALARGNYELRWQADAELAEPGHVYTFRFGPAEGRFVLDALGERELIGDAASDTVPAEIRCALIADALTPIIEALEAKTRQRIELGVAQAQAHAHKDDFAKERDALRFCITKSGSAWRCHGALRFTEERYLGIACPEDPPPAKLDATDFDTLPIALHFVLGATMLSLGELQSIAAGDIIGIERWQSFGQALRCVATTREGHITVTAKAVGTRIVIDSIEENSVTSTTRSDAGAPAATGNAQTAADAPPDEAKLTHLDALEVRVTFELDEQSMPLAELKALKSGYVIELDQPLNQSTVHIRANGALVGQGHLIAVGNKLGVRVSRFSENRNE
jgi:type III secretion protein Q